MGGTGGLETVAVRPLVDAVAVASARSIPVYAPFFLRLPSLLVVDAAMSIPKLIGLRG